ncbi:MAG: (d)CMP kinase [Leptolinea sp.]
MKQKITIAIDGPAASGKSTVGEKLANQLGYLFFDTGIMYRAVTLAVVRDGLDVRDEASVSRLAEQIKIDIIPPTKSDGRKADVLLDGEDVTWDVRNQEVEGLVSVVATYKGVRDAMTAQQRRIGQRGDVVMVGRDIGTVVCPDAELKVYLEASAEERARRRYNEFISRGEAADYDEILSSTIKRDDIDKNRTIAPLKPAADAVILLTDGIYVDEVVSAILSLLHEK